MLCVGMEGGVLTIEQTYSNSIESRARSDLRLASGQAVVRDSAQGDGQGYQVSLDSQTVV